MATSTGCKPPGKCILCGEPSKLKCSKCNAAGLDLMYFCSSEHQKLIWKTHKRVCGSNPFVWPGLTDAEAEEMATLVTQPMPTPEGLVLAIDIYLKEFKRNHPWNPCRDACIVKMNADPIGYFKRNITIFTVPDYDPSDIERVRNLIVLRTRGFKVRVASIIDSPDDRTLDARKSRSLVILDPLGYFAMSQSNTIRHIASNSSYAPWWSEFQWRYFTLVSAVGINENFDLESRPLLYRCLKEFVTFCRKTIAPSHPTEAKQIVDGLLTSFLSQVGARVTFEETDDGEMEVVSLIESLQRKARLDDPDEEIDWDYVVSEAKKRR
ncbi:hypothetical protein JCM3765_000534 [Sporobolomyces pararoseus]